MRFQGTLTTPASVCPSGMAKHQVMWHFMLATGAVVDEACNVTDPSDILTIKQVGPDLVCIGN